MTYYLYGAELFFESPKIIKEGGVYSMEENVQGKPAATLGQNIIEAVKKEVEKKKFVDINYDDHCEWHDAGQGDCEDS